MLLFKKTKLFKKVDGRPPRLTVIIGSIAIVFLPWESVEDEKVDFKLLGDVF